MTRLSFGLLLLLASLASADTTWVTPGDVSGIWELSGSPYLIQDDITVPAGDSLFVAPGVRCVFTNPCHWLVHGKLTVTGSAADSVIITRSTTDTTNTWHSIWIMGTDTASFQYCTVDNLLDTDGVPLYLDDFTAARFRHVTFRFNGFRTLRLEWAAHVGLDSCAFLSNGRAYSHLDGGALYLNSTSTANITDCIFADNTSGQSVAGALKVNGGAQVHLLRCVFKNNRGGGGGAIWAYSPTITLDRCTFLDNSAPGGSHVRIQTDAYDTSYSHITINSCIFANSRGGGGLALSPAPRPDVRYCLFYGNQPLFQEGGGAVGFAEIVGENLTGTPCDRYGNIFVDPLFADTASLSLPLQAGSPCIDAGDPALSWDADDTPPDIGAYTVLHETRWVVIYFPGGFGEIGCPCDYPFQLPAGSLVRLRHDLLRDGPSADDDLIAFFEVAAGAGLPPWDGYWTPRIDSLQIGARYYVELLTPSCCWFSHYLLSADGVTATVSRSGWTCHESGTEGGCLNTDPSMLAAGPPAAPEPLQIAPNPFNAVTELRFALEIAQPVELVIYDITGREVAQLVHGDYERGVHRVRFDGSNLATGIYFVSLRTGSDLTVRKLLLLK